MLSFIRRIINSKVGLIVTFAVLIVIALAFAAGDVSGIRSMGFGALGGNDVASVGRTDIAAGELASRAQNEMEGYRQQQPGLTIKQYVEQGGLDATLERMMTGLAFAQFGKKEGMVVSDATINGQIISIPALQGPNGKFDQQIYDRLLAQRHLSDQQIRTDIARDTLTQQLLIPIRGAKQVPSQLALPYASLLLEKRQGEVGFVPSAAFRSGSAPTAGQVQQFYQSNIARYTTPARRVMRYTLVTPAMVKAAAAPSEAEIAAAYRDDAQRFGATEKRDLTQVVVADRAGAVALADEVRGGTSLADAARGAGLEASTQTGVTSADYAASTTPAVAAAVFGAAKGSVVGPVKGTLGWIVARVDTVQQIPAKSLAEASPVLLAELTKQKTETALSDIHDAIDDALSDNATFDEVVANRKLTAEATPPVLADGTDPANTAYKPPPQVAPIVAAGYAMQDGDPPQMVPAGADGSFALVAIARMIPATPRPLGEITAQVTRDLTLDQERQAARAVAADVVAKAGGMPLTKALTAQKVALPAPRPMGAVRAQLAVDARNAPPPLVLLFSLKQGAAKLLEAPDRSGWYIVKLDRIEPGNAAARPNVIAATRRDIGGLVGEEYIEQFVHAVRGNIGTTRHDGSVAVVRQQLLGQGGSNN